MLAWEFMNRLLYTMVVLVVLVVLVVVVVLLLLVVVVAAAAWWRLMGRAVWRCSWECVADHPRGI